MADKKQLTRKQQMFVLEYLIDLNATQAAIRAGYSRRVANRIASENLTKPVIQAGIQAEMEKRAEKAEISAVDVLKSIMDIRTRAIEQDKLSDALKANELLGKHLRMFTDKVEHSGKLTLEELLSEARGQET